MWGSGKKALSLPPGRWGKCHRGGSIELGFGLPRGGLRWGGERYLGRAASGEGASMCRTAVPEEAAETDVESGEDVRVEFPRGRKEAEAEDEETPAAQCPPLGRHLGSLPYDAMSCILNRPPRWSSLSPFTDEAGWVRDLARVQLGSGSSWDPDPQPASLTSPAHSQARRPDTSVPSAGSAEGKSAAFSGHVGVPSHRPPTPGAPALCLEEQ